MAFLLLIAFTLYADAEAHHRPGGKELRHRCHRLYPMARFYRYSERRYRVRVSLTRGQRLYILRMARCQHTERAERWAYRKRRLYIHRRAVRLAYYRLTPYRGPGGTRWAIPWYIVQCESHGSWWARNPSGAVGPYQLLGWGAIYPARTWQARLQNHRIASRLWDGGAGASNWVCA